MLPMKRRALLFLVLLVAGGLLATYLLRHHPTDEEQIQALFDEAARAAEEKRIGDVVKGLSERFQGEGLDKRGVKQLVAFHVLRGTWVAVKVAGAQIEVRGDTARAALDAVMLRSGKGKTLAELLPEDATVHRLGLRLSREEDGWRITSASWRPISLEEAAAGPDLPPSP